MSTEVGVGGGDVVGVGMSAEVEVGGGGVDGGAAVGSAASGPHDAARTANNEAARMITPQEVFIMESCLMRPV